MKFLMVTTFYPPFNFGGDGVFVYRLSNLLARHGHDVHVVHNIDAYTLLNGSKPLQATPPSSGMNHRRVTVHPLSSGRLAAVDTLAIHQFGMPAFKTNRLAQLLNDTSFDVIHFHNVSLMGAPRIFTMGEHAIKLMTLHEEWLVCPMHILWRYDREPCTKRTCVACTVRGGRPPQWWRYTGAMERAVRHIDAFIAPSRFTREIIGFHGFKEHLHHIPHFMPGSEVKPADPTIEEGILPNEPARPFFLFVGRLEKIKGAQVLIDVFKRYRSADLLIVGRGSYEKELREQAAGLDHVHFVGHANHDQLRVLYSRAVASIVPSICYETFGWVTLESYVMRTPAIVHHLGALPEIVNEGGGGLTYRTESELIAAMETLRTQPETRRTLGEQGYQSYLDHFTEKRHLELYFGLIEQVRR
jgi:glycosyltransferase involved in cell wall biosynthesis